MSNLPKRVKEGGTYFKGYQLTVSSSAGDYVLNVSHTSDFMVSTIDFIPDNSGAGDYITIGRYKDTSAGAKLIYKLADTIHNPGPMRGFRLDFPAIEPFQANEDLRLTYTNVGTEAVNFQAYVAFVGPRFTT